MNNTIKTIIIDDEELARQALKNYLTDFGDIEIIAECSNGFEGLKAINELKPDLIFLDVQMPKISGLELLELLENPPLIIFATAFEEHAIKAFESNAVDYLLKPFSKERLSASIDKIKNKFSESHKETKRLASLLEADLLTGTAIDRILIKSGNKIDIIPTEKVIYLEAQDDYVMVHFSEGKRLKQKTMKYFENNLPKNDFFRIHRSYIVNLKFAKSLELAEKDSYKLILIDGTRLPVSRSGYSKLREIFSK